MPNNNAPQWLREVLRRGFRPRKIYHFLDNSLYGYVETNSGKVVVFDNKIYVLEGLPGVGKTSLARIVTRGNKKLCRVPQILPAESAYDQAMSQNYYFRSEELKTKIVVQSAKNEFILDRYYHSTLAFYWAYDRVNKTAAYQRALRWYDRALFEKKIIKPWLVFYIDIPIDVSCQRKGRMLSAQSPNMWLRTDFLQRFREYYLAILPKLEPQTKIVTLSGRQNLKSLAEKISKFI